MSKQVKVALLMSVALFIEMLDATIVTTALPEIRRALHTSTSAGSLIVSVYLVTVAVFIPLSGWLAKRYGKKTLWFWAVLLFMFSSLGSAMATGLIMLLVMRFIQGMSGALMVPTARLVVLESTPPKDLLRMISYVVWPALIAPAIAPLIGGLLTTYLSWHWIFLVNIPISLVMLLIGVKLVPKDTGNHELPFDWTGFGLIAGLSLSSLVAFDLFAENHIVVWLPTGLLILTIILIVLLVMHLRQSKQPIFGIKQLRFQSYRVSVTGGSLLWLSVGAVPFLMTLYLQNIFGWSAIKTGSYVLCIFIGNIGIKPFTTFLIKHLHVKYALVLACLMVLISSIVFSILRATSWLIVIIITAIISGAGRSLALTGYNGMAMTEVPFAERNSANTMSAIAQNLAQGFGVAIVTIALHSFSNFVNPPTAYRLSFVFLGIIILIPLIEILKAPKMIGVVK